MNGPPKIAPSGILWRAGESALTTPSTAGNICGDFQSIYNHFKAYKRYISAVFHETFRLLTGVFYFDIITRWNEQPRNFAERMMEGREERGNDNRLLVISITLP